MKRIGCILALMAPVGCDGTAWNTTVAGNMAVRAQMAASVEPGVTTESALITRWGRPVQKVHDGAQVDYIYRDMRGPDGLTGLRGDSTRYVIVTFQYGIATAVRTSETEVCRATFPPRPPGPGFSNPTTVHPVKTCPGLYRPPVGVPSLSLVPGAPDAASAPAATAADGAGAADGSDGAAGGDGAVGTEGAAGPQDMVGVAVPWPRAEPIYEDLYRGDPAKGK